MLSLEMKSSVAIATVAGFVVLSASSAIAQEKMERPDVAFGEVITEERLALWNIDIMTPTGGNLPAGQGTVAEGEEVFAETCAACHGEKAEGGPMFGTMVGGIGSMTESPRILTPGSMYPYAPILFDYTKRAMPLDNPQSLSDDEVYAVTAYIYHLNGLVEGDFIANSETLPEIQMPNRDAFFEDDRPDTQAERCMENCRPIGTVADASNSKN